MSTELFTTDALADLADTGRTVSDLSRLLRVPTWCPIHGQTGHKGRCTVAGCKSALLSPGRDLTMTEREQEKVLVQPLPPDVTRELRRRPWSFESARRGGRA